METVWIPIFILSLTECVAPAGKTVCQEQQFELQFLTQSDCELALEQLITLKDAADNVIVDKSKSGCSASTRKHQAVAAPEGAQSGPGSTGTSHQTRLEALASCEETEGVAPCKIGEIIVEDATRGEPVEVWHREQDPGATEKRQ